jgi:hypothetical protein
MKCSICSKKIETTFMNKIVGTVYTKGKKHHGVCKDCQSRFTSKEIKEKLGL